MFVNYFDNNEIVIVGECTFLKFNVDEKKLFCKFPLPAAFETLNRKVANKIRFISYDKRFVFGGFTEEGFRIISTNLVNLSDIPDKNNKQVKIVDLPKKLIYGIHERSFTFAPTSPYLGIINGSVFHVFDYEREKFLLQIDRPIKSYFALFSNDSSKLLLVDNSNIAILDIENKEIIDEISSYGEDLVSNSASYFLNDDKIILLYETGIKIHDFYKNDEIFIPFQRKIIWKDLFLLGSNMKGNSLFLLVYNAKRIEECLLIVDIVSGDIAEICSNFFSNPIKPWISLKDSIDIIPDSNLVFRFGIARDERDLQTRSRYIVKLYDYINLKEQTLYYGCVANNKDILEKEEWKDYCEDYIRDRGGRFENSNLIRLFSDENKIYEFYKNEKCKNDGLVKTYSGSFKYNEDKIVNDFKYNKITAILSGTDIENMLRIVDDSEGKEMFVGGDFYVNKTVRFFKPNVGRCNFATFKNKIIWGEGGSSLQILNLDSGKKKEVYIGGGEVSGIGFDMTSNRVVTEGYPKILNVYDIYNGKKINSFDYENKNICKNTSLSSPPLNIPSLSIDGRYVFHDNLIWDVDKDSYFCLKKEFKYFSLFTGDSDGIVWGANFMLDFHIEDKKISFFDSKLYDDLIDKKGYEIIRVRFFEKHKKIGIILYSKAKNEYI